LIVRAGFNIVLVLPNAMLVECMQVLTTAPFPPSSVSSQVMRPSRSRRAL
jgi:hypothetical protein